MRIVIDMQGAQSASRHRGIGRYSLSFVKAIIRNRGEHEIILALNGLFPHTIEPIRAEFDEFLPQSNIRVWNAPGPTRACENGLDTRRNIAELLREAFLEKLEPDVIHITSIFEGFVDDAVVSIGRFDGDTPVSAILYDLIPLNNPVEYLSNPEYEKFYRNKLDQILKASSLQAISEFSKSEFLERFQYLNIPVTTIHAAVEPFFEKININIKDKENLFKRFGIALPFVLFSGATDERKNLPRLIEAYSKLDESLKKSHQIVLAGGVPNDHRVEFERLAKCFGLNKRDFVITGWVTDNELVFLYNLCKVYIFPSWHEGFGLPALEAMTCGAPVISANTSSLPEVVGYDEAMFDPFDVASIVNKLKEVLTNEDLRQKLILNGAGQAKKFNWCNTAQKAISSWVNLKRNSSLGIAVDSTNSVGKLIAALTGSLSEEDDEFLLKLSRDIELNQSGRTHNRLFVDISELIRHDARTGIQRVVRNILREWLKTPKKGFDVEAVYATGSGPYRYARAFTSNFIGAPACTNSDDPIDYKAGDIFFVLDMQPQAQCAQAVFYQHLRQQGVTVKFMVYDLLCILQSEYFPEGASDNFSEWLKVVGESDGAICISQAVADDLSHWMQNRSWSRLRPFNITANHLGADVAELRPIVGTLANTDIELTDIKNSQSFLMVGTLEPRKGHTQVLDAFEKLWSEGTEVNLVIVGKQGWMVDDLISRLQQHKELDKRLFWLEGISDEYLENVYEASTCLIAASYGEGFGLPLIEAAQHKLPIICRDIPVFREVAGDHAHYFVANNRDELAYAINQWLNKYKLNLHQKSDHMPWLTWNQSAKQLLTALDIQFSNTHRLV